MVTLTLVIGLSTKLITPLSRFMKNYAGSYVSCLLEVGELPYFLSTSSNPQCTFENMQASGRFDDTSSSSSVRGSGSSNNSNSKAKNNSNNSTDGSDSKSRNGSDSNRNNRNNAGGNNSRSPRLQTGSNTGTDSGPGSSSGSIETGGGQSSVQVVNNERGFSENGLGSGSNDTGQGISGSIKVPRSAGSEKKQMSSSKPIEKSSDGNGDNLRKGSFSAPVSKPERKVANSDLSLGFNLGMYLRYFIIAGLILALIIMVGTQINSLRKGWGSE